MEKVINIAEQNTKEINEIKNQYKGIGPLLHELNYEIQEVIDELDIDKNPEVFEHLIKISRMSDILEDRLRKKNSDVMERVTVEYLLHKFESNLLVTSFGALICEDEEARVISRNDVRREIKNILEESQYIA